MYMLHYHFAIFLVSLKHIFYPSDALVMIKFKRAYEHYWKNRESFTTHDPLGDYDLERRIQLCDDVLNAKQFSKIYPRWYQKRISGERIVNLTKWDPPPGVPIHTLNYQRTLSAQLGGGDSPVLQYNKYANLRMRGSNQTIPTKRIQCVRTKKNEWFVTFGMVDGFLYLLESDNEKKNQRLRLPAILEPGPLLEKPEFNYFQSQYEKYKDEMESICMIEFDDHMRLCAAILDTLDQLGKLTKPIGRTIHVQYKNQHCVLKIINMNSTLSREYFSQCQFVFEDDNESSSLFYMLADSSERGAAFVFLEGELGILELYARMVKIGALVNPVGRREVQLNAGAQSRDGEEKIIKNNKFVTWRELQNVRNEKEKLRYHERSIGTSKIHSQSEQKSKKTRHKTTSDDEKELEDEKRQKERSQKKRKLLAESKNESSNLNDQVLQKSEEGTSTNKRHFRYAVKNKDPDDKRATKEPKLMYEKNEYQRDRLEKVSDSSEEEYEQVREGRPQVLEERSERKDRTLSELKMLVRTFAEPIEKDLTNKSEISPFMGSTRKTFMMYL